MIKASRLAFPTLLSLVVIVGLVGCSSESSDSGLTSSDVETRVAATLDSHTATPSEIPAESLEPLAGFARHILEDGSTVDIPEDWISLTLDEQTLSGISSEAASVLPEITETFGGESALSDLYQSGAILVALDNDWRNESFSPNVNIIRQESQPVVSMTNFLKLTSDGLAQAGFLVGDSFVKDISGTEVAVIVSDIESPAISYSVAQYMWFEGDDGFVLTMSYVDRDSHYIELGEKIVASMQ